jgi:hypothetical protein
MMGDIAVGGDDRGQPAQASQVVVAIDGRNDESRQPVLAQHSVRCQAGDSTVAVIERVHLGNHEHRQQGTIEGIVESADAVPPLGECANDASSISAFRSPTSPHRY